LNVPQTDALFALADKVSDLSELAASGAPLHVEAQEDAVQPIAKPGRRPKTNSVALTHSYIAK
jgi:hypothetical protein